MDPLKRFDYLRNGKPSSVMIRATPNSVRWDEINRVQYRFQALNFQSDVLEALIHNSPPLSRRERAATTPQKKINQSNSCSNYTHNEKKDAPTHARVKCVRRSASFDASNAPKEEEEYFVKRKASVVQITKDDTSDYNSDEDVFPKSENGSLETINYNATICHVQNRSITDTTQIHVTNCIPAHSSTDCNNIKENRVLEEAEDNVENNESPNSTKLSPSDSLSSGYDDFNRTSNNTDGNSDIVDLSTKTKEELIAMVRQLQEEARLSKETIANTQPPNNTATRQKNTAPTHGSTTPPLRYSPPHVQRQRPVVNLTSSFEMAALTSDVEIEEPQQSVFALIDNFEKQKHTQHTHRAPDDALLLPLQGNRVKTLSSSFENEMNNTLQAPTSQTIKPTKRNNVVVGGQS